MREIDPLFQERLSSQLNFLCRAWIITPKLGEKIRISEHDREVKIRGHNFRAIDNFDGGVLDIQKSLGADRCSIAGSFNAQDISKDAILLGHFDKAKIEMLIFDWQAPQFFKKVWEGMVGRVILHEFGFEFEINGPESELNRNIGRKWTKHCNANLGDNNCKLNLANPQFQFDATISRCVSNSILEIALPINFGSNFDFSTLLGGEIIFQSNLWSGFRAKILKVETLPVLQIHLHAALPLLPDENDSVKIIFGCDKSFECCKNRFGNAQNFFGFPFMPGEGVLYASP